MIRIHVVTAIGILSAVAVQAQEGAPGGGGILGGMLPMMAVMFAIIYFLMIRPEQKKQKQRQQMLSELKKGDRVVTAGGLHGTVQSVKDDMVQVKAAETIILQFSKSSITNIGSAPKGSAKGETDDKGK